jgi:hypothetical protein
MLLMTILMMTQVILHVMMIQQIMFVFLNVAATTTDIMIIQVLLASHFVDVYSQGDRPDRQITLGVNEDSI